MAALKRGRPAAGVRRGERVKDYPTLKVPVPPETRAALTAIGEQLELPLWRVLMLATSALTDTLSDRKQRAVRRAVRAVKP